MYLLGHQLLSECQCIRFDVCQAKGTGQYFDPSYCDLKINRSHLLSIGYHNIMMYFHSYIKDNDQTAFGLLTEEPC